jgi:GNAT superfamily N-acetyltransferase
MADYASLLRDFAQGASNSAAGTVAGPVDIIAWLLKKAGVDTGTPVGGSDWMAQQGLMAQPQNKWAGLLGETTGAILPMAGSRQGVNALMKMQENAAAAKTLHPQAGVIDVEALKSRNPQVEFSLAQRGDGTPAELTKVVVPKGERGQGVGSKFMQDLTAQADIDGAQLRLSPSTDFGGSSVNRLKEFYKEFGFVENKGKSKDFTVSNSMYREPSVPIRKPFTYPQDAALATAQRNAAKPIAEGGLGLGPNNTPAERAAAMGFNRDVLHGTKTGDIRAFDKRKAADSLTWITDTPYVSNEFATNSKGTPTTMLLKAKLDNPADWKAYDQLVLDEYKSRGYDGAWLKDGNEASGFVLNPNQLRSRFAAFDPARRNEADLLGGATPGLLSALGLGAGGLSYLLSDYSR